MVLLPLLVLHAPLARLPTPRLEALVCQATAAGSSGGSSSGSGSDSGSTGSASSAGGSSGGTSSASSGWAASGSGGGSTASSTGGGSATGSVGTQPGDGEPGTVGIPTRCNSGDDCPLNFFCTEHKCKPLSQRPPSGGCTSGEGAWLMGLLALVPSLWRRRHAR